MENRNRYRRKKRFKPGRYVLLLLVLFAVVYVVKPAQDMAKEPALPHMIDSSSLPPKITHPTVSSPSGPAVIKAPVVEDQAHDTVLSEAPPGGKKEPDTFTAMDEITLLEAIDIVAIELLELRREGNSYHFDAQLVFVNESLFPVRIVDSELDATMLIDKNTPLRLGKLKIRDVVLSESADGQPGRTSVDVVVAHGETLDDLKGIVSNNVVSKNSGILQLPLLVKGRLSIQVPLIGGFRVDRTMNLNFEYQPFITTELLETFRASVRRSSGGSYSNS